MVIDKLKKDKQTYDNAQHLLKCVHFYGRGRYDYLMPCHVLKTMPNQRLKVRVFGNRFFKDDTSRVRYVESYRVIAKSEVSSPAARLEVNNL